MHKICFRVKAHIPTPYPTGKGIGLEKKMCKKASWYVGCGGWRGWPPLQQPGGQAEPHAAPGVEIGAADMWKEEPAQRVCGPLCWERQGESLGKLQARVGEEFFWM